MVYCNENIKTSSRENLLMHMNLLPRIIVCVLLVVMISACGGLRFSEVAPDIGNFHPEKICVFPVDAGAYMEVATTADTIIADAVSNQGFVSSVITPASLKERMNNNNSLEQAVTGYLAKLKAVHFSDPDMSRRIGAMCDVDSFLVVNVDFWNYTRHKDDKLAKAGFSMNLIEARTGKIVWTAKHYETKGYNWFKPDLDDLAEEVAEMMISHMPH